MPRVVPLADFKAPDGVMVGETLCPEFESIFLDLRSPPTDNFVFVTVNLSVFPECGFIVNWSELRVYFTLLSLILFGIELLTVVFGPNFPLALLLSGLFIKFSSFATAPSRTRRGKI